MEYFLTKITMATNFRPNREATHSGYARTHIYIDFHLQTYHCTHNILPQTFSCQVLRIVGGVRLRQVRVANDSCTSRRFLKFGKDYDTKDGTCYSPFELPSLTNWFDVEEDTRPFGPPSNPNKYK